MFDLEKAISEWKKGLAGKPALDETYILELEAVLRDEVADLVRQGRGEEEAFRRVKAEMGEGSSIGSEFSKVRRPRRPAQKLRRLLLPDLLWNYARISLRKVRLQKGYSFINIAGLAVGLACCLLMTLWVRDELSFDRFHKNRDSIFRMISETKTDNGTLLNARAANPLGPAAKTEIPEVADYCRYATNSWYGFFVNGQLDVGPVFGVADPSFFTIFSFPFVSGDPKTALAGPKSIVITERLAHKYFGVADPMGKTLFVGPSKDPFTVTGVIRDVPPNSHLHFDCVIPAIVMADYHHVDFKNWKSTWFCHYVLLATKADPAAVARKITNLLAAKDPAAKTSIRLQPLRDAHLKSDFAFDFNYAKGSVSTLTTFSIAAAAVLLLACINFMNLATARSANRAKEVGLRKVTGARRSDLVKQFLGESVMMSFVGLAVAVILVSLALPLFNNLAGKRLELSRLFDTGLFATVLGLTLLSGLLAGSYPALFLSAFRPANILRDKGLVGGRRQAILRKFLVVVQFALTVFLVIGTLVVDKQLKYIRNKNLGIDTHQVVSIQQLSPAIKDALLANPAILNVSVSMPPGLQPRDNLTVSWEGKNPGTVVPFLPLFVDEEYLKTFRIGMAEGRFFSKDTASDRTDAVVVNETAARVMGTGSPVGKHLTYSGMNGRGVVVTSTLTVIGVIKDFHQTSLHRTIEPMFMVNNGQGLTANIRIRPSNIGETLKFIENTWKKLVPNYPFSYNFIDDQIDGFYKAERKIRAILGMFTVLALFTACLGLVGLASFIAERKTKEIGIRKVLGASTGSLVLNLTREFALWVLVANVVAWPAAYFGVGRWLQGFAYRVSPGVGPAALAASFSLVVALLAVGYKAVRASLANPVDPLKYE